MRDIFKIFVIGMLAVLLFSIGAITYINYKSIAKLRSEINALQIQYSAKIDNSTNSRDFISVKSSATTTDNINQNQSGEPLEFIGIGINN